MFFGILFKVKVIFFEKNSEKVCMDKNKAIPLQRQTERMTNSSIAQSVRAPDC